MTQNYKKKIKILQMNRNIKWKEKKNRVGRETLKRCAELEFILICSNCFFQWLTYLTRTTGYYFRLINTTTFRKKTCLTQSIATSDRQVGLILYLSHHGETQQIETWKDMQPKFCIFYTCHLYSIGGRLGTFSQILRMQTVQTKMSFISGKII